MALHLHFKYLVLLIAVFATSAIYTQNNFSELTQLDQSLKPELIQTLYGGYNRMDMIDDVIIVSGQLEDGPNGAPIHIYLKDHGGPDNWGLYKTLRKPYGNDNREAWGIDFAISEDYIAVGSPYYNQGRGAVYLYGRHVGGTDNWGLETIVLPQDIYDPNNSNSNVIPKFGQYVAIDGDVLGVISDAGSDESALYTFAKNNGGPNNWGAAVQFIYDDSSNLLSGVDVSDKSVIAATIGNSDIPGYAILLELKIDEAGQHKYDALEYIYPDDGQSRFGRSVAINGDYLLIGAPNPSGGSAYVFHRNYFGPNNWGQIQKLTHDGSGNFGYSVSLDQSHAVIGSPAYNDRRGAFMVYEMPSLDGSGQLEFKQTLTASDGVAGDEFGTSVAHHNDYIASSAFLKENPSSYGNNEEINLGIVYVYSLFKCYTNYTIHYNPIPGELYQASQSINSKGRVAENGNVTFEAACINLMEDFEVSLGGEFLALNKPCK